MDNASHWSVDQLAASNLAAALKLDASDATMEIMTRHFSEHRRAMLSWAGERILSGVVRAMEAEAMSAFENQSRSDDWTRGYSHAEALVCGLDVATLLDLIPPSQRTKGRILRSMIRQARKN